MPKKKQPISAGAMARIMRKILDENAMDVHSMRISEDGSEELGAILYEHAREIILRAARMAVHAKRKTIKRCDIDFAKRG